jgi:hypothetical protein
VTPRGPLTPEERLTIDIFDRAKRSFVYISTSQQLRDLWSHSVRSIPRGTGSGIIWDDRGRVINPAPRHADHRRCDARPGALKAAMPNGPCS